MADKLRWAAKNPSWMPEAVTMRDLSYEKSAVANKVQGPPRPKPKVAPWRMSVPYAPDARAKSATRPMTPTDYGELAKGTVIDHDQWNENSNYRDYHKVKMKKAADAARRAGKELPVFKYMARGVAGGFFWAAYDLASELEKDWPLTKVSEPIPPGWGDMGPWTMVNCGCVASAPLTQGFQASGSTQPPCNCLNNQGGAGLQPYGTNLLPTTRFFRAGHEGTPAGRQNNRYLFRRPAGSLSPNPPPAYNYNFIRALLLTTDVLGFPMQALAPGTAPIGSMSPFPSPIPFSMLPKVGNSPFHQGLTRTNGASKTRTRGDRRFPPKGPPTTTEPGHSWNPPKKNTKETKVQAGSKAKAAILLAVNAVTETRDFINALWNAMPPKLTKQAWKDYAPKGKPGVIPEVPFDKKLELLWKHIDQIDVPKALVNVVYNHVTDKLYGKLSVGSKQYRAMEQSGYRPGVVGFETGPAL